MIIATACSHAILKASIDADHSVKSDGMVILDFDKDWRFKKNNFGEQKFYAAAPIYSKSALGDGDSLQPIGLLCLLDPKPRDEFNRQDRDALIEIADRAGAEIARLEGVKDQMELERLKVEREKWRSSTKERRSRFSQSLTPVEKQSTKPLRDSSFDRVAYTTVAPLFSRKLSRPGAVSAIPRRAFPLADPSKTVAMEESNAIIDLATRLISETLEMDLVYLIAIDTRRKDPSGHPHVRILSVYNLPNPPPLFDVNQHLQLLSDDKSSNICILFVEPDFAAGADLSPAYSTGVITRVSHAEKGPNGETGVLHLLAGFSEEKERVFKRQDVAWMMSFGHDLRKFCDGTA